MCDPVTATYVTLAVTGATTMMSIQAQKASMKMQQQQAEFQRKQFKMQADAAELETVQAENTRKKKYLSKLNENRALFSKMNITTDSPSYRAFLKANKEIMKKDVQRLRLQGTEKRLAAMYGVQQADLTGRMAKVQYKQGVANTVGRSLLSANKLYGEIA